MDNETRIEKLNRYLTNVYACIDGLLGMEEQTQGLTDAMRCALNEARRNQSAILSMIAEYEELNHETLPGGDKK